MKGMADAIRPHYSQYPLPTSGVSKFLMYLAAPFLGLSYAFVRHNVDKPVTYNCDKIKTELGFTFRPIQKGESKKKWRL